MSYVVAGVSGNTGKVVAETLLSQGAKVRVVVRDPKKGEPFQRRGAEVAVADLSDAAALEKAFSGAEGAYVLVPPQMAAADMITAQKKTIAALTTSVRASKIRHVVLLSSVGAQHAAGTGPIVTLHAAEQALAGVAGTAVTALRAAYFMENIGGFLGALDHGVFPTFLPAAFAHDMVATRDIGVAAAGLLREGPKGARIVQLAGPNLVSANDVARILSSLTGKEIKVAEAPLSSMASTLESYGFVKATAALYQEMTGALQSGHVGWDQGIPLVRGTTTIDTVLKTLTGK
jgi:uncharacterized protein YbjT (DUF2867 family)